MAGVSLNGFISGFSFACKTQVFRYCSVTFGYIRTHLCLLRLLLHLLLLGLLLLLLLLLPPLPFPLRQLPVPLLALPEKHRPRHRLKLQVRPRARVVVASVLLAYKYRRRRPVTFRVIGLRLRTRSSVYRWTRTLRLGVRLDFHMHRFRGMHRWMVMA